MSASPATPTETVSRWLESPENRPQVEKLVLKWNELQLLGIDLADQLHELARTRFERNGKRPDYDLNEVDWSYLAENYALEICGVTEEELTRRRESASE